MPKTAAMNEGDVSILHATKVDADHIAAHVGLPGSTAEKLKIGVSDGHGFRVMDAQVENPYETGDGQWSYSIHAFNLNVPLDYTGLVHYPWDPAIKEIDVHGAARAYLNADKTAWLAEHCDADYHHDHEDIVEAVVVAKFQREIDELQLDANTKLATLIKALRDGDSGGIIGDNTVSNAASRELAARVKLDSLLTVRGQIVAEVLEAVQEKYIGYYHQFPNLSHIRDEIADELDKAIGINTFTQNATYLQVSAELGRIAKRLRARHSYERRWEYAARIEAERKAREAARAAKEAAEAAE